MITKLTRKKLSFTALALSAVLTIPLIGANGQTVLVAEPESEWVTSGDTDCRY